MTNQATLNDIAEFRLIDQDDEFVRLSIPGTDYKLSLVPGEGMADSPVQPGRRIRGRVNGSALKMHRPPAGGNYIEPVMGHPRIVQGTVIAADPTNRRLLIDLVVPVWVELMESQSTAEFSTGDVVTFYMNSGTSFTPVD
ncbi:MAG: hypothetical protein MK085_00895 [Phycisphaerales bacterium]|nr:hypothetical protein [Phycisphaerales bacterium]